MLTSSMENGIYCSASPLMEPGSFLAPPALCRWSRYPARSALFSWKKTCSLRNARSAGVLALDDLLNMLQVALVVHPPASPVPLACQQKPLALPSEEIGR